MKAVLVLNLFLLCSSGYSATWKKLTVTPPTSSTGTAGTALTSAQCPTNFIFVSALSPFTFSDFCVAKYEMKNDGYGTAASVAAGTPWVSIDQPTARAKCQALGPNYDMISNGQWQTIARNIAGVAANWSTGTVTSGQLNTGHSDNAPTNTLAASTDDVSGNCSGTGQTCTSTTWNAQRRTHVLASGAVIWDFAGNVWEWVTNLSSVAAGTNGKMSTFSTTTNVRNYRFGAAAFCATPSASPYCGMGTGEFNYTSGGIIRGGAYQVAAATDSGVFATSLNAATSLSATTVGFRCVFTH